MFNIEKNVPIPFARPFGRRESRYPYESMEVGDSFLVPTQEDTPAAVLLRRMRQSALWASKRYNAKFQVRSVPEGGVRVWRVE